ncbi:hypothetical protein QTP70_003477 [Hemibagrus guttatus]|uniref:Dual specificity phosphatase catalytic domain-containing protein n=1 Tax=Hemibagrus guttatus TaxID=175788 RepID=A0AAE0REA9_9TELE|nr:hypothetical protein QTP70_003477 [Hemibagrus guttatus]
MVDSHKSTQENTISSQCDSPTVEQLEEILHGGQLSCNHADEVWPSLFLGDMYMSHDRYELWRIGITHVLNAAHGKMCCKVYSSGSKHSWRAIAQNKSALRKMGITHILNMAHAKQGSIGDESYYGTEFVYHGIPAEDSGKFDISVHFRSATDFIHKALKKKNGKVLVHCIMGQRAALHYKPDVSGLSFTIDTRQLKILSSLKELCAYETPSVAELQDFLLADRHPTGHVNQVWPNVYIGNEYVPGSRPTIHKANSWSNRLLSTQLNTYASLHPNQSRHYYSHESLDEQERGH